MEKIKITQAQRDAIEQYKNNGHNLNIFVASRRGFHSQYKPLKEMTVDDMARLLYEPNSYEVEPEFKVGDNVLTDKGRVMEILREVNCDSFKVGFIANGEMYKEVISKKSVERHATDEEVWWARHGRKPWQVIEGDMLWNTTQGKPYNVFGVLDEIVDLGSFQITIEQVKAFYKVICFVDSRLDVKANDI